MNKMKKTWVLIADASKARVFEAGQQGLDEILELKHPESRLHGRELETDAPGRVFESANMHRAAMAPTTTPHDKEVDSFVHQISSWLDTKASDFDALHVFAPPSLLGKLRKTLGRGVKQKICEEVSKDVVKEPVEELWQRVKHERDVAA